MSSYGWSYLSRSALRRADRQLAGNGDGVRDEIGFLIIHQRYADYFFPGTSVLHTRLRYALFVPWIYQTLYEERSSGRTTDILRKAEVALAGRLKDAKGGGAIGGEKYPEPISQPPSVSYWGALGTWGILRDQDGRLPSRAHLSAVLQSRHRRALDDDGQPLGRAELPFTALPKPPTDWIGAKPMEFDLLRGEAEFLHGQLVDLRPHFAPEQLSLFAKLPRAKESKLIIAGIPGSPSLPKRTAINCGAPVMPRLSRRSAAPSMRHWLRRCGKRKTISPPRAYTVTTCRA